MGKHLQPRGISRAQALPWILSMITPEPTTGCWLWTGGFHGEGYPLWKATPLGHPKTSHVARDMLRLMGVHVPFNAVVVRTCGDAPWCLNPDHLRIGTLQEASIRSARAGRKTTSKLTPDAVRAIRDQRARGRMISDIAKSQGVSISSVKHVLSGRNFAWVDGAEFPRADRVGPFRRKECKRG